MADEKAGGRRRGYAKGRAKREEILDAAMALFGEVGYNSASLREIANRCGITHPGLIHHFPTKELLLQAVLERRDAIDEARMGPGRDSSLDQIRTILALVKHNMTVPHLVELFSALSGEATSPSHPAHAYFADRYERIRTQFAKVMADGQREGVVRSDVDPAEAAISFIALWDGLQVQWLIAPDRIDMVGILKDWMQSLLIPPAEIGEIARQ